jgi:hypothetical protein
MPKHPVKWHTVENNDGQPIAYASKASAIEAANYVRLSHLMKGHEL